MGITFSLAVVWLLSNAIGVPSLQQATASNPEAARLIAKLGTGNEERASAQLFWLPWGTRRYQR